MTSCVIEALKCHEVNHLQAPPDGEQAMSIDFACVREMCAQPPLEK